MSFNGTAKNSKDPLLKSSDEKVMYLMQEWSKLAHGFSYEDIVGASVNMLINVMRQSYVTKQEAEVRFDEVIGQTKQGLMNQYDSISGRKKGVFPYDQVISPGVLKAGPRFI